MSLEFTGQFIPQRYLHIGRFSPSQADVTTFKSLKASPEAAKFPHAFRWYKHVASYQADFSSLPGDPAAPLSTYGPDESAVTINPKDAPNSTAADEEEEEDLFGSDSEEEDPEAVKKREENLAAYKAKKAGKTKPAAKSIVTMDVKPWGKAHCGVTTCQTCLPDPR
jgi:elongation factor 1-beta